MSIQLLDRTRKINRFLHNNHSDKVVFNDVCEVLSDTLASNILVISKKGKVLGVKYRDGIEEIRECLVGEVGQFVDSMLNERLLGILSTMENVTLQTLGFEKVSNMDYRVIISPIVIAGERLGTLFLYRNQKTYGIDDIILSEYGTTVVGLEIMRSEIEESQNIVRMKCALQFALRALSYSEKEAVYHIFEELKASPEGLLVTSKIADRAGITRSVIVNALRKLESAGIVEAKSSGMKGTHIKVLNEYIFDELDSLRRV
ncbi:MAG: GTP-sensing pleiotropic transcriptional regulator CodY [Lachnospiraceae bacterium]